MARKVQDKRSRRDHGTTQDCPAEGCSRNEMGRPVSGSEEELHTLPTRACTSSVCKCSAVPPSQLRTILAGRSPGISSGGGETDSTLLRACLSSTDPWTG